MSADAGRQDAQPQDAGPQSTGRRRRRLVLRVSVLVVVVAAVLVVVEVRGTQAPAGAQTVQMLEFSGVDPVTLLEDASGQPSAGAELLRLAAAADHAALAGGTEDGLGSDAAQRVDTYTWYLNVIVAEETEAYLVPSFITTWLFPDGSGQTIERRSPALTPTGTRIPDSTYPVDGSVAGDTFGPGTLSSLPDPAALPRDPDGLRAALLALYPAGAGCEETPQTVATCLVQTVGDLHHLRVVQPDLIAAAWRVLADTPGVVHLGTTTDRLGRSGVGFAVAGSADGIAGRVGQVEVIVVSPEDGRLLGWERISGPDPQLELTEPAVLTLVVLQGAARLDEATGRSQAEAAAAEIAAAATSAGR